MNYEIGSRIGDYEILQILGAGGMGRVYKVRNTISDRIEAMKVLLPNLEGNSELAERFTREIKVQASLEHANIAALHTALRIENQLLMLMEYVEGTTLESMMESGPVPIDKAIDYVSQVLAALSYAHGRGVIHRDLKPANIMVTASGLVKLMDFGIAKMAADRKLTQTGTTVGSLYYMSPEQINGTEGMDARSDLYSLGVTLYEVATGARPFQGDSEYSIMAAHLQGSPRPPIQISPGLLPGLSEIIMMAIEKDPGKRFQTADAFRNALGIVGGRPRPAGPAEPTVAVPVPAAASRPGHRGLWMSIGALVVLVVLAVVALQIPRFRHTAAQTGRAAPESAPAQAPVPVPSPNAPAQAPLEAPAQNVPSPAEPAVAPEVPKAVAKTATPAPATPAAAPAPAPSAAPVPPAPTEDPQIAEQLKGVRDQLDLLHIRAAGVRTSLDGLRRQQAASGLNLRADMASSAQRMDYHLSQTQSALSRRDPEAAKRSLDAAEREVSNLEDFLHR